MHIPAKLWAQEREKEKKLRGDPHPGSICLLHHCPKHKIVAPQDVQGRNAVIASMSEIQLRAFFVLLNLSSYLRLDFGSLQRPSL